MKKFIIYNCEEEGEQMALVEMPMFKVILQGDEYHDKISTRIEGFLEGLKYNNIEFETKNKDITKKHKDYKKIGLY